MIALILATVVHLAMIAAVVAGYVLCAACLRDAHRNGLERIRRAERAGRTAIRGRL